MQVKDKYFNGKEVDGEVGIEIELEGNAFPEDFTLMGAVDDKWTPHHDGSLRGACREYVLTRPVPREEVGEVLTKLHTVLHNAGTKVAPSVRTGVHVHINVRQLTVEEVFKFMLTWFIFESILVRYCGEDRVGNLFCLRGSDAEAYMEALEEASRTNDLNVLYTDELRYSAMNPKALCEYGSLEFRCLKSPEDIRDIEQWVKLLLKVKDFSLTIDDPREFVEQISVAGGDVIAEEVFGELLPVLPAHDWTMELYDGLRLVQPIIYGRDWNSPEQEDVVLKTELPATLYDAKKRGVLTAREVVEFNV